MKEEFQNISAQEKMALKFLERDFNQCFEQMRHYDSQIFNILKFLFTGYTFLIGIVLTLYQLSFTEGIDLCLPIIIVLSIGLIIGIFMFAVVIRSRVYFIKVTRYINEHREFFLKFKPMGFKNKSSMYTSPLSPPYFNWKSSQSWYVYVISFLNSTILGILLFILTSSSLHKWFFVIIGSTVFFIVQLIIVISYLKSRERKAASEAGFRTEKI